jgi:hypothetical protein
LIVPVAAIAGSDLLIFGVAVVCALVAGAVNAGEPVRSGLLVIAPTVVGGVVRTLAEPSALPGTLVAAALAAAVAVTVSHIGAGVVLHRRTPGS